MSTDKVYTLLERLELNLDFAAKEISAELSKNGIYNPGDNWIVLDRAIGGGQLTAPVEEEFRRNGVSPKERVYGCEKRKASVQYAISTYNLQGTYTHTGSYTHKVNNNDKLTMPKFNNISFTAKDRDFKLCEVGNYPYNDGSINNTVIWHKFIEGVAEADTDFVGVVVQASFLSQQYEGRAKQVKDNLKKLGCYKIVINDYSDFDEDKAKVKTCIVFCRKGYTGDVIYEERKTKKQITKPLHEPFIMNFDKLTNQMLTALYNVNPNPAAGPKPFSRFPKYEKWIKDDPNNKNLFAIGSYYRTEGFDKNPLKPFKLLDPAGKLEKANYVIFGSAATKEEAEALLLKLNSFWFSDVVQAILLKTRYSISLDATQYAYVPETAIDRVFTNDELFDLWKIPEDIRNDIIELVKDCDYKNSKEKDAKNS